VPIAETEQAKWAVSLRVREYPPGDWPDEDDERARWSEVDLEAALRGFSLDLCVADEDARQRAAEGLGWLGDARAVSPLLRALGDPADAVRREAARALSDFHRLPEWTVEPLVSALSDADSGVRTAAAAALGDCDSDVALDALVRALDDPARAVRCNAARALEWFGCRGRATDRAIAKLSAMLDDEDPAVAYNAFWGLRGQGGSASDARCSEWRWSERGQAAWASRLGG
jgi:HEAT repeat protein